METTYVQTALSSFFEKYKIVRTHVARMFSQTNNLVINRWLNGSDIYVGSLLKICNAYEMDLLSFFKLNGHTFKSTLHDLMKFEESGLSLKDVMLERGIEPTSIKKYRSLSEDVEITMSTTAATPNDLKQTKEEPADEQTDKTKNGYATMSADILDRFVQAQTAAYAHEQASLQRQREDMQKIIDHQEETIKGLQKELKKYKRAAAGIKPSMTCDDTDIDYEATDGKQD